LLLAGGAAAAADKGDKGDKPAEGPAIPDDVIGQYLADLEKTRRLPAETASLETLRATLASAEDNLVHGDARVATTSLYAIVESPRYSPWKDTPPFQNAEFLLGRALLRGGAYVSAERYLLRVLKRGPEAPYFVPAHRALVDLALETRSHERLLATLEGLRTDGKLPEDSAHERAYLRGRLLYEKKDLDAAANALAQVGRTSRFYASSAYFRGLIAVRRGTYKDARGAFCEIVPRKDAGALAFNIDGRYFSLQDLARLALARVAHEQDKYDEAYYFYFSIPDDSERLAEALFEAAWSMYQKGEARAARAFVDEFDQQFPQSALRPEVAILRANIEIKSCAFDGARAEVAAMLGTYGPIQREAARASTDAARRRALVARLLTRPAVLGPTTDDDGRLLSLLKLDARFTNLYAQLREVEADLAEAREALGRWRTLGEAAQGEKNLQRAVSSPEAAQLLEDVTALAPLAEGNPEMTEKVEALLLEASLAAYPPRPTGPYAAEEAAARDLVRRLSTLRTQMTAAALDLGAASFRELDERLRAIFRQARLVSIDAVVGRKKRLEIEIANLQARRLTSDIYAKLKAEGTLGDDEEYWPFEGEYWADEYENYR
jgi:TolA-binding protein